MSRQNNLLNDIWTKLSDVMEQIFQFRSVTRDTFMTHYNMVYRYFLSEEYRESLFRAPLNRRNRINQSNNEQVDINIPGGEMYFKLKNFLKRKLETIAENRTNLKGEDFLRLYVKIWQEYQVLSKILNNLFASMNSNWLTRLRILGYRGIYDVYTTTMHIWQDIFFKDSNRLLSQTCFNLIKDQRNGKYIDSLLIRQVVQSYADFTKDEGNNRKNQRLSQTLTIYINYFEKEFFQDTELFYKMKSNDYYKKNSIIDYLKNNIQHPVKEEEYRLKDYLHPTTLDKLKPNIVEILIKNHLEDLYIELIELLHQENI